MNSTWLEGGKESLLHAHLPALAEALTWVEAGIDLFAITVMLIGVMCFVADFLWAETSGQGRIAAIDESRIELGRYSLAGLELFIVSDIIETALSLQLLDLVFLGLLVAIRSAISHYLEREVTNIRTARTGADDLL